MPKARLHRDLKIKLNKAEIDTFISAVTKITYEPENKEIIGFAQQPNIAFTDNEKDLFVSILYSAGIKITEE